MSTSKVLYQRNLRTESVHLKSGKIVISDAPVDNQGKGDCFSPTDYCATSLAMCMLTIAGIFIQNHDYELEGSFATVNKVMGTAPRRITQIDINIKFKPSRSLTDNEKIALERATLACPVAKSLHPEIVQNCSFNYL